MQLKSTSFRRLQDAHFPICIVFRIASLHKWLPLHKFNWNKNHATAIDYVFLGCRLYNFWYILFGPRTILHSCINVCFSIENMCKMFNRWWSLKRALMIMEKERQRERELNQALRSTRHRSGANPPLPGVLKRLVAHWTCTHVPSGYAANALSEIRRVHTGHDLWSAARRSAMRTRRWNVSVGCKESMWRQFVSPHIHFLDSSKPSFINTFFTGFECWQQWTSMGLSIYNTETAISWAHQCNSMGISTKKEHVSNTITNCWNEHLSNTITNC